jgi:hypothetical protein
MLAPCTHVGVGATTARRRTEHAGAVYEAVQTAQVEELERTLPAPPQGPAVQLLSVDGAMVPLVGEEWAEVKTLALGVVQEPVVTRRGEQEIHTTELSYFSRLTDHETFGRLATVETHRRGTETAGVVCAVVDGAAWEQEFIALHRPDAARILDWGHAVESLATAAQAAYRRLRGPFALLRGEVCSWNGAPAQCAPSAARTCPVHRCVSRPPSGRAPAAPCPARSPGAPDPAGARPPRAGPCSGSAPAPAPSVRSRSRPSPPL